MLGLHKFFYFQFRTIIVALNALFNIRSRHLGSTNEYLRKKRASIDCQPDGDQSPHHHLAKSSKKRWDSFWTVLNPRDCATNRVQFIRNTTLLMTLTPEDTFIADWCKDYWKKRPSHLSGYTQRSCSMLRQRMISLFECRPMEKIYVWSKLFSF